jgi:hypothetical protein
MIIENPAVRPSNRFNEMTQFFKNATKDDYLISGNEYWIILRDGKKVRPWFHADEGEYCEDCFMARIGEQLFCWNLDGTSVTRPDYDMMRIVTGNGL